MFILHSRHQCVQNKMFFELCLVLLLIFALVYFYFIRNFNHWKNRGIPYVKPLPLFGNFKEQFLFKKNLGYVLLEIYNKCRDGFVGIFVSDQPFLLITDVELVRAVLVKDFQCFEDRTVAVDAQDDPVSGNILLLMQNPQWKTLRHKLSPFFSSAKLKQMMYLMLEIGGRLKSYLEAQVARNEVVDVREVLENYATEVISSCAFGLNSRSFENEEDGFKKAGKKIFDWDDKFRAFSLMSHFLMPWLARLLKLRFVDPTSAKFLKGVFIRTLTEREQNKTIRNDLLDLLIKLKNEDTANGSFRWDEDVLLAQAIQFFMAGFETSGSTVGFTLFELAWHPDVQDKLRKEVRETIEKHGSCGYEAIKEMSYLDMVIKETLRKYPILPFLDRICNQDYTLPGTQTTIEKGTKIIMPVLGFHYDERYFPEPEKFDPERFSDAKRIHPYTYLPFGEGPRNCIGARFGMFSAKIGVATMVANFLVEPCAKTPREIKYHALAWLLSPVGGLYFRFKKINQI